MIKPYNEATREANLDFFCTSERPELAKPFSIAGHSYASNGHWLIRVPRRADIVELVSEEFGQRFLSVISDAGEPGKFYAVNVSLPEAGFKPCVACGGSGKVHSDCPCCECECSFCDGDGVSAGIYSLSVGIGASPCAAHYLRHLLALPDFRIAPRSEQGRAALWFSFDGGDGLLMPLESNLERHINAELVSRS